LRLDGNEVRQARERLGYSMETLAEAAGVAKNSILRAEHEEDIRPVTARKIANALEVRVADLLPKAQAPLPFEEIEDEASAERRAREFMTQRPSDEERIWFIEKAVDILRHYHDLGQKVRAMMREDLAWHGSSYVWRGYFYKALQPAMERDGVLLHASFIVHGQLAQVSERERRACEKLLEYEMEMHQLISEMYTIDDANNRRVREESSRAVAKAEEFLQEISEGTPAHRGQ
jgi:transcriptional regulator with XRE-family HTH domain